MDGWMFDISLSHSILPYRTTTHMSVSPPTQSRFQALFEKKAELFTLSPSTLPTHSTTSTHPVSARHMARS